MPQLDPNTFTPQLFWFVITFVLLYLAMWRIIIPSIGEILQNRQIRIDNDLQKAEQLKKEAEIVRETYEKLVSDGRQAAQDTIRSAAEKMRLEVAEKHEALTEKLMGQAEKAEDHINSVKKKALDEIQLIAVEITQVAATRLIGKTISESLAIELSTTLTIEQVIILFFLHMSKAAYVSAVSPDCDTKTYKQSVLNLSFRYLNSEAISTDTSSDVYSSNQYFANKQE